MSKFGECPSCDGFGDHGIDEEGCWMVCHACGDSGKVPAEVAIEARRDRAWSYYVAVEAAIKRRAPVAAPVAQSRPSTALIVRTTPLSVLPGDR